MGISLGTTIGAAATAPISNAFGGDWRLALWVWVLPAALTIPVWLPFLRDRVQPPAGSAARSHRVVHPCTPMPAADGPSPWRLTHSRTAWAMAIFFGLQASEIFCSMGFLAQIFRDARVYSDVAGLLLAVAMAIGVPASLVLPAIAGRMRSQGVLVVGLAVFGLAGFAGLLLAPAALPWVWAFLIGVASTSFPLALVMAHVVGHDWGAAVAWSMAMSHPDRVQKLVVVSVGHPGVPWPLRQNEMAWYELFFQFEGIAEATLSYDDWAWLWRFLRGAGDQERYEQDLSRPGALTASLNWYRANLAPKMPGPSPELPPVRVPTLGIWSTNDHYLARERMEKSGAYVKAPWRYEVVGGASHWIPLDSPDGLNALLLDWLQGQAQLED